MKKFKKLLILEIGVLILAIVCMVLMFAGYNTSTLRFVLFALIIFAMNYNLFLIFYYWKCVKGSKK